MPNFLRTSFMGSSPRPQMFWPKSSMEPASGRWVPMMVRSRVDLPEPEPPMMTMVSPGWTSSVMPSRTVWAPKRLTRFCTRITGSVLGAWVGTGGSPA